MGLVDKNALNARTYETMFVSIIIVGHPLKYRASPLKYGALTLYLVDLQGSTGSNRGAPQAPTGPNALYYPDLFARPSYLQMYKKSGFLRGRLNTFIILL